MKQLTFMGETPKEALTKATDACGEDAMVVSTKKIKEKTKDAPSIYEVVVIKEDVTQNIGKRRVRERQVNIPGVERSDDLMEVRKQNNYLLKEIEKLNKSMSTIQMTLYNQLTNGQADDFIVPPEFLNIYNSLISSKIERELVHKIIQTMIKAIPMESKDTDEKIEKVMNGLLNKMIKTKETVEEEDKKKLMILFGPTGVGKTTTIAKIGMEIKAKDSSKRIGLVNLDTFRVGAEKQAIEYGKKFGFNVANASHAKELIQIITKKMKNEKVIMIDTAGSGQYDNDKIEAINEFLNYNKKMRIEKSLLIPANIKYDDMMEIYEGFKGLGIDSVIFTKLDETNSYGNIFTFLYNTRLKVSHFTTGQQVPNDIEEAKKNWFLDKLMKASEESKIEKRN